MEFTSICHCGGEINNGECTTCGSMELPQVNIWKSECDQSLSEPWAQTLRAMRCRSQQQGVTP